MRHQRSGKKLGRDSAHRKALYANLAGALIEHGRIRTTVTKAKAVRPIAEQMITLGRRGDLHARRQAKAFLRSQDVVHKLFSEVGPSFAERPGGYTRIVRIGPRAGDAAEMAYLELVDTPLEPRSRTNGADAEPVEAPVATAAAETVDEAATEDDVRDEATGSDEPDEEGASDDEAEESDDEEGSAESVAGAEAVAADDDEAAPPTKDV